MRQEFKSSYPAGTDFYLMLDSARIIAAHMGENLPDTLGLDDLLNVMMVIQHHYGHQRSVCITRFYQLV